MSDDPDNPFEFSQAELGELNELNREWVIDRAYRAIVEIRRHRTTFMARMAVSVLVPVCEDCFADEVRATGATWRPPDIDSTNWVDDLKGYGVTNQELKRFDDPDVAEGDVRCHGCGVCIDYRGTPAYVDRVELEEYFPELVGRRVTADPPRWMKKLAFRAYEAACFGCCRPLSRQEATFDHITPRELGGRAELLNIQLLCEECNNVRKGATEPAEEHIVLRFALVPPPCDSYDGPVW